MKGRQASDRSPLKTAAGLITQHRTGPKPLGAVPSLSRAATIAATPPAAQDGCATFSTRSAIILIAATVLAMLLASLCVNCAQALQQTQFRFTSQLSIRGNANSTPFASFDAKTSTLTHNCTSLVDGMNTRL